MILAPVRMVNDNENKSNVYDLSYSKQTKFKKKKNFNEKYAKN